MAHLGPNIYSPHVVGTRNVLVRWGTAPRPAPLARDVIRAARRRRDVRRMAQARGHTRTQAMVASNELPLHFASSLSRPYGRDNATEPGEAFLPQK